MQNHEKYKAEERRQTDIITKAMTDSMANCSKDFEAPMINSVIGALVGIEIAILSSIEDGKVRKAILNEMEKQRRIGLRHALNNPKSMNIELIKLGGLTQ